MYFMPQGNAFYLYVAQIKKYHRYVITFCVSFFLLYGWLYGIYFRLERVIDTGQKEVVLLQKQKREMAPLTKQCQQLQCEIENVQSYIQPYIMHADSAGLIQARTLFLLKQIKSTGLKLNTYRIENPIDKNWYTKQIIHVDATGSMPQIDSFLTTIAQSNMMLQCNTISVQHMQRDIFSFNGDMHLIALKKNKN